MRDRSLLGFVVGFVAAALVFGVLERLARPAPPRPRTRRELWTDLAYWVFTPWVTRALTTVSVGGALVGLALLGGFGGRVERWLGVLREASPIGRLPLGAQVVLGLLLADLVGYWAHRLFHAGPAWRFHAIHHSSKTLDWLASTRLHPVNDAVQKIAIALPLLLLGFDPRAFAAVAPVLTAYALLLHADVPWTFGPLRRVLASPHFHRWHHAADEQGRDVNFAGLFAFWDVLFGTFHLPAGRPSRLGVDDAVPEGLWGQLRWPFRS